MALLHHRRGSASASRLPGGPPGLFDHAASIYSSAISEREISRRRAGRHFARRGQSNWASEPQQSGCGLGGCFRKCRIASAIMTRRSATSREAFGTTSGRFLSREPRRSRPRSFPKKSRLVAGGVVPLTKRSGFVRNIRKIRSQSVGAHSASWSIQVATIAIHSLVSLSPRLPKDSSLRAVPKGLWLTRRVAPTCACESRCDVS